MCTTELHGVTQSYLIISRLTVIQTTVGRKNLRKTHVHVHEILRYALDDSYVLSGELS